MANGQVEPVVGAVGAGDTTVGAVVVGAGDTMVGSVVVGAGVPGACGPWEITVGSDPGESPKLFLSVSI